MQFQYKICSFYALNAMTIEMGKKSNIRKNFNVISFIFFKKFNFNRKFYNCENYQIVFDKSYVTEIFRDDKFQLVSKTRIKLQKIDVT